MISTFKPVTCQEVRCGAALFKNRKRRMRFFFEITRAFGAGDLSHSRISHGIWGGEQHSMILQGEWGAGAHIRAWCAPPAVEAKMVSTARARSWTSHRDGRVAGTGGGRHTLSMHGGEAAGQR